MYNKNDLIYLDTGDFEFVLKISELEGENYRIANGMYRMLPDNTPEPDVPEPPDMDGPDIDIDDIDMTPLHDPPMSVPMWIPVSTLYDHYPDKKNFDIEPLSEITRHANSYEFDMYCRLIGYGSAWKEELGIKE
jgi:hypothetical protein